jgi:flagellar biosynthesis regulator FlaF
LKEKLGETPMLSREELVAMPDRRREYLLLDRLNEKLIAAKKGFGATDPQSLASFLDAVQHNREVWNAFALDVTHQDNSLPSATKKLVAELAVVVNGISNVAIQQYSETDVDFLASINRVVMEGLSLEPQSEFLPPT